MEPAFEQYVDGSGELLECPACGDNYLHHERVEVFEREEDKTKDTRFDYQ